jgi:hypothetical protein
VAVVKPKKVHVFPTLAGGVRVAATIAEGAVIPSENMQTVAAAGLYFAKRAATPGAD